MRHFVIDTNFVHLDFFLRGTNITALAGSADKLGHSVYMPQVVFDELCKQYYEEIEKAKETQRKYFKELNRVNPVASKNQSDDFDKLRSSYEQVLTQRCQRLGIQILDYPKVEHREMVLRELNQRKPFKDSSKGYRDALIWETVLSLGMSVGENDNVIFLTENTDDFAKEKIHLHPDLISDSKDRGLSEDKIKLITGFHHFIKSDILPAAEQMTEKIQELLNYYTVGNIDIHEILGVYLNTESLQHLFDYNTETGQTPYAPWVYANIMVHYMTPYNMSIYDVRRVSDDNVLISVHVEFDLFIDCFIYKGDFPLIDDRSMPEVFDKNWNEHYVAASDRARFKMQYDILTDPEFKQANNVDEQVISAEYETGFRFLA